MARLDELAEGVASMLQAFPDPEPLSLTFNNHTSSEIAFLVQSVIAACDRIGQPLAYVRLPSAVADIIANDPDGGGGPSVAATMATPNAVEFGRFPR